jgi:hypothetical protein
MNLACYQFTASSPVTTEPSIMPYALALGALVFAGALIALGVGLFMVKRTPSSSKNLAGPKA